MELKKYLVIIYKRLWIIILLPLFAGAIASYVGFYLLKPVYESDTSLYVINKAADPNMAVTYNDLIAGQFLVKDYRELVRSRSVTMAVIGELKIKDMTPEKLASKISVSSKNDTRIIEIKIQDNSPTRARDIAEKVGSVFMQKLVELMKVENVSIIDNAQVPLFPVKPRPTIIIAIAVFAGFFIALCIIALVEYMDDTIKTPEDAIKYLNIIVLGTIPVMSQSTAAE